MMLPFLFINGPCHKQRLLVTVDEDNRPREIWDIDDKESIKYSSYKTYRYYAHEYSYKNLIWYSGFVFLTMPSTPDFDLIRYCKSQGINL